MPNLFKQISTERKITVAVIFFALLLVAGSVFASMTLNTNTIVSDGALNLNPTGQPVTVNGDLTVTGVFKYFEENEIVSADRVLTIEDSGKTFYVGTDGVDFTLPTVATADGAHYRVVLTEEIATTDITIVTNSSENKIQGIITGGPPTLFCEDGSDTIIFDANSVSLEKGDSIELRSDGATWYLTGVSRYGDDGYDCVQASP